MSVQFDVLQPPRRAAVSRDQHVRLRHPQRLSIASQPAARIRSIVSRYASTSLLVVSSEWRACMRTIAAPARQHSTAASATAPGATGWCSVFARGGALPHGGTNNQGLQRYRPKIYGDYKLSLMHMMMSRSASRNACFDPETENGCYWLRVDYAVALDVRSECDEHLDAWDHGDRAIHATPAE